MSRLLLLICLAVLTTGCAEMRETTEGVRSAADSASKAADCAKIATDVAKLQIDRATDPQGIDRAAQRLEERVSNIDSQDVRSATSKLADSAQQYADAVARGDTTQVERARLRLEKRARDTAEQCGVRVDTFLG